MRAALLPVLAVLPLTLSFSALRGTFESRMAIQMTLEFPLLLASGWAASMWLPGQRLCGQVDMLGLASASWASAVMLFWMLPVAVDASLLDQGFAWLKYASWWSAGLFLGWSWHRMGSLLEGFFLGNAAWMLATAGLLYLDADERFCVNYRYEEQAWTGSGLLFWSIVLGRLALIRAARFKSPKPST